MFPIKINRKTYNVPSSFDDVTIEQMIWLQDKAGKLPEAVQDCYKPNTEQKPLKDKDQEKRNAFESEVLAYFCNIPSGVIVRTPTSDIAALFDISLLRFVFAAFGYFDFTPQNILSFDFDGSTLYLPEGSEDIAGDVIPASNITAQEFCDASDLACSGNLNVAPLVVSVLCRPKGEAYNEKAAQKKAKSLRTLPMNIYLEVYYLLKAAHEYQANENPECYGKGSKSDSDGKAMTWCETLYNVCDEKPSEIPYVQKMNVCDFMKFLNGKIKQQKDKWKIMSKLAF